MSYPDATVGRFRAIDERIKAWIEDALHDADYHEYYVTTDYTNTPNNLGVMPYITIKTDRARITHVSYGRYLPKADGTIAKGVISTFFVTLHVYDEKNTEDDEDDNYYAQKCSRIIMDYLDGKDQDSTEKTVHYIDRVYDIGARESDPVGFSNLRRIIMSFYIDVRRIDSP